MNRLHQLDASFRQWLREIAADDPDPMSLCHNGYCNAIGGTTTGRYVVLRVNMGLDNKRLLEALDEPTIYQLIPWDTGNQEPQVYLDRQRVAIEAPLPRDEQDAEVKLEELTGSKHGGKVIILGPNEAGTTVSLPLHDLIHVLIGGETGAGKTYTMRSLAYQLANGHNSIVLIDGKRGDGLGILNGLPGQVGPLATSAPEVRNALGWVRSEMIERYDTVVEKRGGRAWDCGEGPPHLVVFFDEFQEYRADDTVTTLLHDLAAMGRSARVHLVAGTQKPTVKMFGSDVGGATRDQFGTRIGHRVSTYQASSAIIGSNAPRADKLLPRGDAYVIGHTDGYPMRDRVQIAYVDEDALYRHTNGGRPQLERWPEFDVETVGSGRGRPRMQFSDRQIAVSIHGARRGYGRPTLQELLEDLGEEIPGSEPAGRLLEKGRRIQEELGRLSG